MDEKRLPRKLAFAKLNTPRRRGGQALTYGRRAIGEVRRAVEAADSSLTCRFRIKPEGGDDSDGLSWMECATYVTLWNEFIQNVP